jgi:hypothetical protein
VSFVYHLPSNWLNATWPSDDRDHFDALTLVLNNKQTANKPSLHQWDCYFLWLSNCFVFCWLTCYMRDRKKVSCFTSAALLFSVFSSTLDIIFLDYHYFSVSPQNHYNSAIFSSSHHYTTLHKIEQPHLLNLWPMICLVNCRLFSLLLQSE